MLLKKFTTPFFLYNYKILSSLLQSSFLKLIVVTLKCKYDKLSSIILLWFDDRATCLHIEQLKMKQDLDALLCQWINNKLLRMQRFFVSPIIHHTCAWPAQALGCRWCCSNGHSCWLRPPWRSGAALDGTDLWRGQDAPRLSFIKQHKYYSRIYNSHFFYFEVLVSN